MRESSYRNKSQDGNNMKFRESQSAVARHHPETSMDIVRGYIFDC